MQKVRSSYGTFGIVYEVTFRRRPLVPLAVRHETYSLEDFIAKLPELEAGGGSLMYYIFPFDNLITVSSATTIRARPEIPTDPSGRCAIICGPPPVRRSARGGRDISDQTIRYGVIDGFNALWRLKLTILLKNDNTVAADQIIRYPAVAGASRYTFSLWAFPEQSYPTVLSDCFDFCRQYYKDNGYRIDMLFVGYRVAQDRKNSLLSYSYDGNAMTIDPVCTANPGWETFLLAYNQFWQRSRRNSSAEPDQGYHPGAG